MATHNPAPGIYVSDEGTARVDLKAVLRNFGRPTDETEQRKLSDALKQIAGAHGVAFRQQFVLDTGTSVN